MASETERITHEVCDRHEMPTQDYPHAHILWSARAKRKIDWRLVCELAVIAAAIWILCASAHGQQITASTEPGCKIYAPGEQHLPNLPACKSLVCGEYQHREENSLKVNCTSACIVVEEKYECVDDMHEVTEREWQLMLAEAKANRHVIEDIVEWAKHVSKITEDQQRQIEAIKIRQKPLHDSEPIAPPAVVCYHYDSKSHTMIPVPNYKADDICFGSNGLMVKP